MENVFFVIEKEKVDANDVLMYIWDWKRSKEKWRRKEGMETRIRGGCKKNL